ncbi:MAG: type II toxin-antitoxin system HicB family antitoxin [Elusimicrobia bacterium]|nr:type II toxin-antitoxin system HicB family antitoxin [Elusimicrobiota bacterium]
MEKRPYAIRVLFSKEDGGYIATVPELPGCSAFSRTSEKAVKEVKVAVSLWLKTAGREERSILNDKKLLKKLRRGSRDAKARRGQIVR